MKRAVIKGKRKAALVEALEPRAKENWVVVKVQIAPMCTEYKAFLAGTENEYLGHEAVGEVVEVAQPGKVAVGGRVVVMPLIGCGKCALCVSGDFIHCQSAPTFADFTGSREGSATMAQYLLKPDWMLPVIPPEVSFERAALALCALGPSYGAFQRLNLGARDTILITGLGPVGLGAVVNARYRNARVIGVEGNPYRAELARKLGAEVVLDPSDKALQRKIADLTGGIGVDCGLDCAGSPAAHRVLLDAVRRRGQIAFVGECTQETVLRISPDLLRKGLTLHGSWHYNLNDFPGVMQVAQQSPLVDQLVTHTFPLTAIQEAFETLSGQQTGKVLIKPWSD